MDPMLNLATKEIEDFMQKYNIDIWSRIKRGYDNPPHIIEWCSLINDVLFGKIMRLCVIAPRDHAKSEVFAINTTAWCSFYGDLVGIKWVYIFCDTQLQANDILDRITDVIVSIHPELASMPKRWEKRDKIFSNGFRITVRGAEASVRGAHPDLIIGDDVLSDNNSNSNAVRENVKNWWFRTVSNMTKPSTRVIIEGTVQHQLDLLMSLKDNPSYVWRRYPAWR